jgi:predicted DNA-binding transcriptional regulator YafY
MDRAARLHHIDRALRARRAGLTLDRLARDLSASRATIKRDLEYLRRAHRCPIFWDRAENTYRLDPATRLTHVPGAWFSPNEIHALLAMHELLRRLGASDILGSYLAPLNDCLNAMLGATAHPAAEVKKRITLIGMATRTPGNPRTFGTLSEAVLTRKRLDLEYHARSTDAKSTRQVSPQRLVHYRDNWYLDAWCHSRRALRSFAVDAVQSARLSPRPAIDIGEARLDRFLGAGYGILRGTRVHWAVLRFTAHRARWVAQECWHPEQKGTHLADGRYQLKLPYSDPRELMLDVLRYGPEVEVIGPKALRGAVYKALLEAVAQYSAGSPGEPRGA